MLLKIIENHCGAVGGNQLDKLDHFLLSYNYFQKRQVKSQVLPNSGKFESVHWTCIGDVADVVSQKQTATKYVGQMSSRGKNSGFESPQ